ncbi:MAG TPA: glycosyl transferase family 1 [Marinilabiliales bacterium]|nr:MAG: glycosyl transferase family 1 [Bacteroidetes bacterium GWC2_40_13]HBO75659.1 glycosyl transferase family 1 [Marinilabiliales bacterium]
MAKRIVILGTAYPFRGGLAVYNERLAKALNEEGHEVTIETFKLQYPGFLFPGKTQYADWAAPSEIHINISVNSINPVNWIKVGRKIKQQKPDFVIIKYWLPFMAPCFGTIARIVRKNKHTKVISILDNIIPHEKRPGDRMFSRYFSKSVDAFVAMSKRVLNDLDQFDTQKPRAFCPHPLYDNFGPKVDRETALEKLQLSRNFQHVLFFGLIRDYKGLDWLLEAFADPRLRNYKVKLIVAGEFYSDKEKYTRLIEQYQLKEYIELHNRFIPDPEVGWYFAAADLIAQPYKSATQSGVTQIGYHFEKPMLVTNVGGLSEIIPDQKVGYVVEPNPKAIADKLVDFFENRRSQEFVANLVEEKKKYAWSTMTGTIFELYQKLTSKSG